MSQTSRSERRVKVEVIGVIRESDLPCGRRGEEWARRGFSGQEEDSDNPLHRHSFWPSADAHLLSAVLLARGETLAR